MSRALAVASVAVAAALSLGAPPAGAHGSDAAISSVLDSIAPALPPGVQVTVETSVAAEVVVSNPTATPVEALDETGRAFLRISARGVEADVSSPAFVESSAPAGRAAASPASAPPRFVKLSAAPTWSWFDHRLHPADLVVPAAARAAVAPVRLAEWSVPLRYGRTRLLLRGHVDYRRPLGRVVTSLDDEHGLPAEIRVGAVDGRLPALFVHNPTSEVLTVLDAKGSTYAEIGPAGVEVDATSEIHLADRRARGEVVVPVPGRPRRQRVSVAPSYTWLDPRLRPPGRVVPDDVQRRRRATTLVTWRIPYRIGTRSGELRGTTGFVPFATSGGSAARDDRRAGARHVVAGSALGGCIAVAVLVAVRRRRSDVQ